MCWWTEHGSWRRLAQLFDAHSLECNLVDSKDKKAREHGAVADSHNATYAIHCAHYENNRLVDGQSPQIFHVLRFVGNIEANTIAKNKNWCMPKTQKRKDHKDVAKGHIAMAKDRHSVGKTHAIKYRKMFSTVHVVFMYMFKANWWFLVTFMTNWMKLVDTKD
jgi:hypothetical protein